MSKITNTSILDTHPEIASQWHPTKNSKRKIESFTAGSNVKVWWYDNSCNHEWIAAVYSRTQPANPAGCSVCSGKTVLAGFNDFGTTHPELAKQWHPTKNTLTVHEVMAGNNKKFWWHDEACGHDGGESTDEEEAGS